MRRHIISPLRVMPVDLLPLLPLIRRDPLQRVRHVLAYVLVPVLVEAERARRVLDEEVQEADAVRGDLGELARDAVGDQVGAARGRREGELLLEPHRRGVGGWGGLEEVVDVWEEGEEEEEDGGGGGWHIVAGGLAG